METLIILTSIALVVVTFFLLRRFLSTEISNGSPIPLPPGKMGWPIIGESLDFFSCLIEGRPEKFIRDRINKYASSTFKTSFLGDHTIVMYGVEGNKFLFSNDGKLVKGWWPKPVHTIIPGSKDGAMSNNDMIQPFIKLDVLQNFIGIMDSVAQAHFQAKWHAKNEITVHPMAKEYALTLACKLFLSIDDADFVETIAGPMSRLIAGLMSAPIDLPWTRFGRGVRASKLITSWMKALLLKRRQELLSTVAPSNHRQDMVSHLMQMKDENGKSMGDDEIADKLTGFILAGHDTAASVITIIFKYLGENPDIYNKVHQEQREVASSKRVGEHLNWHDISKMKYSWNVAQEAMRMYPPSHTIYREATSDFTYHGYRVPKGWKIQVSVHATHRDPQYFLDPGRFDPSRFEGGLLPYTYLPFGGGPRICPGRNYAQAVVLVFLHNAINRFKWEAAFPNEKVWPNPTPIPEKGLPICLYPH